GTGGGLPNPFAPPPPPARTSSSTAAASGEEQYGIIATAPPVNPAEVEAPQSAVEVVMMWGDSSVLHVEHLSPPRTYTIGEGDKVDYLMESSVLGTSSMPIVVAGAGQTA